MESSIERTVKTLLVSGGTGTGKTTLLRILANSITEVERIFVSEDTPDLQIRKLNLVGVGSQTSTFKTHVSFDELLKGTRRRTDYHRKKLVEFPFIESNAATVIGRRLSHCSGSFDGF